MIYRGFQVERVIYHANATIIDVGNEDSLFRIRPHSRVQFVISELVTAVHWQDIGSADSQDLAMEMIDQLVARRESSENVIRIAA